MCGGQLVSKGSQETPVWFGNGYIVTVLKKTVFIVLLGRIRVLRQSCQRPHSVHLLVVLCCSTGSTPAFMSQGIHSLRDIKYSV